MTPSSSITNAREALLAFAKRISTGPLSLHHALLAGIAALDAGADGHLAPEYRRTLDEHTGGWFGKAAEVRELLAALGENSQSGAADSAIETAAKLIEELQLDREGATSVSGVELRDILRGLGSRPPMPSRASAEPVAPTMKADYGKWICLDWYDGPISEIALVTFDDGRKLAEIKCQGGWVGEDYRVGQNGEKFYVNHMRFDRETLVAMLDLIDGKSVKDFHED